MTVPSLVPVASYVNAAQADLAQMQLAISGIPAYPDNAAFVSWYWHCSNATGGAKVCVAAADAEQAHAALFNWCQAVEAGPSTWQCPQCNTQVDSDWTVCWHCGTSTNGEEDPSFFEQPAVEPLPLKCSEGTFAIVIGITGPLLFLLSGGSVGLLVLWLVAFAGLRALQTGWPADEENANQELAEPSHAATESDDEATAEATEDDDTTLEDTILRAWQAAVLSLWFFPLALYSFWLLLRLDLSEEPLKPRERRRYFGAWAFSLFVTMLSIGFVLFI